MNEFLETLFYYILPGIVVLVLILVLISRKKKPKKSLDNETLEKIYLAFGSKENIKSINRTQDRVSFIVKDVKKVNNDILKELDISAFLKKNEITILFKNGSKNLVDYINSKMKE